MEVASVDARIEQVTVYATGARVRRVTTIPAPLPTRVRIVGLPLGVIDDTVRIEVGGPAVATAVRTGVDAPAASDAVAEETPELRAARRRVAIAETEVERINGAVGALSASAIIEPDPSDDPPPPWGTVIAARRGLVALRAERELALREQLAVARREGEDARRALEVLVDRERRGGTARGAKLHELRKYVELELVATAASEIQIHLEYLVSAARWAPSYVARIEGEHVKVEVRAVVAHSSGEDWTGVPLRLSTAEPEQFAMLPELHAQKIGRRQAEPGRAGFRAPPVGAAALYADYERSLAPARTEARPFTGKSQLEDSTYEGARPLAPPAPPGYGAPSADMAFGGLSEEVWDEESSRAKERFATPSTGVPMPQAAASMPKRSAPEKLRLEGARDAALARAAAARVETEALRGLVEAGHHDLAIGASRGTVAPSAATQLAELDAQDAAARVRRVDAELDAQGASTALQRLEGRIARAEAEAGEEAARLVIDVIAEAPTDLALTVSYVVPGAAWRPYHRAVLARAAGRVDWTTTACVWQATGEDWIDCEVTFSLERASLGVDPPDLTDDEVRTRRRPDSVVVESREQEQQSTGLGGGPLQVPGIDDGGLGVTLTAAKTTIKKDGMPHRVPVGGFTAPTQLSLVAIPLRSPWVHVRARIVNTGTQPLLAGPVDLIMASGYVGRAEVGFVATGEKFHLGFGPEADVRVHRTETRERDEAGLLGGWNTQTVRVAVRLSNLGTERREINVTERIPISEVEQVDVQISSPDAYLLGTDDQPGGEEITQVTARAMDERGLVTWGVELPPLGRRAVTLEYRIKSQRGVAGVG